MRGTGLAAGLGLLLVLAMGQEEKALETGKERRWGCWGGGHGAACCWRQWDGGGGARQETCLWFVWALQRVRRLWVLGKGLGVSLNPGAACGEPWPVSILGPHR